MQLPTQLVATVPVTPEVLNTVLRVVRVGCAPLAAGHLQDVAVAADEGGVGSEVLWVYVWDVDGGVCRAKVGKVRC